MLDRQRIVDALRRLAELLHEREAQGEVCLLGGTVMVLAFSARPATRDVDAIFEPASIIRNLSRRVAGELDLPEDWLNDGATAFVSAHHETTMGDLPQFESLRLTMPTPEYLLAMKCMASRIGAGPGDPGDVADIRFLITRLGLRSAEEARQIVARYYPEERIPPRATYLARGPLLRETHMTAQRPVSLAAVAAASVDTASFHLSLGEFVDEFRRHRRPEMLAPVGDPMFDNSEAPAPRVSGPRSRGRADGRALRGR